MGSLVFASPTPLLWAIPVLLLAILWIRTPIFISSRGKHLLLWIKLGILSLLVLAMLDPRIELETVREGSRLVFALDVSESVDRQALESSAAQIASIVQGLPRDVEGRIVAFSGRHTVIEAGDPLIKALSAAGQTADALNRLPRNAATDLGEALIAANDAIPSGRRGRIILISDGRDTHGGTVKALDRISDGNIPVDVFPLPSRTPDPRPRVVRLVLPEASYAGEEVKAQALIYLPSGEETAELTLTGTDGVSENRTEHLLSGYNAVTFSFKTNKTGVQVYGLTARTARHRMGIPVRGLLRVRPLPRALLLDGSPEEGRFLREALRAEKIEFAAFSPASWPTDLSVLIKRYPCLILNNIPKSAFKDRDLTAIRDSVHDGNGLMMIGGPNSFGPGDYTDSPVEDALPVRMPRRTVNKALSLVLLLDCSGSMAGSSWTYLVQAAKEILRLCKGHYVGIVLFSSEPVWAVPLQKIVDPEAACAVLDNYAPGGGTIFSTPLAEAFVALKNSPSSQRSILMMSDGEPADFFACVGMFENFRDLNIPITTVAAGVNVNPQILETIASETGGVFYQSLDFADLPNLFRKEFKRISGPPTIEEQFTPLLSNSGPITRGIKQAEIPPLMGLVITQLKPSGEMVMANPRGDPVIARWRYGLGRSVAFTPDLLPNWSRNWASWNGLGKLLRQTVKDLSEGARESAALKVVQKGMDIHLTVDPGSEPETDFNGLEVTWASSMREHWPMTQASDGCYEASLAASAPGVFPLKLLSKRDSSQVQSDYFLPVNESREFEPGKTNQALLRNIAEKTGGEVLDSLAGFAGGGNLRGGGEAVLYVSLWPWIALAALLLYIIDIFLRKSDVFGVSPSEQGAAELQGEKSEDIYRQLAQKFLNMAEEYSLKGEEEEAKRYYLRAKAFFMKGSAVHEAQQVWERYKRFDSRS
ncbi:MAG: VWA domain-containing protein [Candidatus Riflebacteria bacterium]|nr:VWA domain-containing protein [Candidatus Riflebacteria bacterium]